MLRYVALVRTDVSEELSFSFIPLATVVWEVCKIVLLFHLVICVVIFTLLCDILKKNITGG
jgi:hypothetical protein